MSSPETVARQLDETTTMGPSDRRTAPGGAAAAVLLGGLLLLPPGAEADHLSDALSGVIVPTGRQEYFVLGHDQHVWNMMERVRIGVGGGFAFQNGMNSVVSAVASSDGQVVTYDHWEDGFESDIYGTVTNASTLVLGDANTANGRACDYTNDPRVAPCNGDPVHDDTLYRGSPLTFNSDQGLATGGCTAGARCTVPVNPRGTSTRFDGGDRLATSGGPLSLIHNQFPPPYPQIGGSTEVLPRQAFAGATSYYVPAGEDRYAAGGPYQMFRFTALNIVAFDDGTQVFINSPGASGGTVSLTLDRGQHYTNCLTYLAAAPYTCTGGGIDGSAAAGVTINASTKISATGPVAILMFAGGQTTPWATDFMPILPDLLHGNDYVLPGPGDNPGVDGSRPLNVYAYNPDSVNAILVTASDRTPRTNTIAVAASGTVDYRSAVGDVPASSTVRLTSDRSFWGFALHDHLSPANDWGYSWLASDFLTRNYTVSFAPGVNDPATSSTPAQRTALPPDPQCTIPPPGAGTCDSIDRSPVFVAASLDGTFVKVDFDNDGIFDLVDTNSDDYPDNGVANDGTCGLPAPPWNVPGATTNCLYRIDALQVLRVYDYTDYDNTGTRIQATKPISVAYGQDTDQATGPDPILDTGYTVYPLAQRFLDPVLVVGKAASPTVVSGTTGGQTTFTITVQSYGFAPVTGLTVTDLLPMGLSAADYVAGSTLVTYPDLSQSTADPGSSIDPATGRTRLAWTLSPSTLGADQTLTVSFAVGIPPGASQTFSNETVASGVYGGRTFAAVGGADVVRTNVSLVKLVTDDGAPEPGDVLTYTLQVTNAGTAPETSVRVTDAVPGTTFVAGSITSSPPFTGTYDPLQNAAVWTAASLAAGASATLSFQVRINDDTDVGAVIANRGIFESVETPTFFSNETLTTVVGPLLAEAKTIAGGAPAALHPLDVVTFEVQVSNSGSGTAANLRISDPLAASNTTCVAGTMEWSQNGAAFAPLTDAADGDAGTLSGTTPQLLLAGLAPGADVRFRFQARVDPGTGGLVMNNQATVSADRVATTDTNLVQVPIEEPALTGLVFRDLNANGALDPGEPGLAGVAVLLTYGGGSTLTVSTDALGVYQATVPAGSISIDVVDATLPAGAARTAGPDPQSVTVVAGTTTTAQDVGYSVPSLHVAKVSDAGGTVAPGQLVTYTVTVTNNSAVTQTGLRLTDAVPTGTTFVSGSARVAYPTATPFRVTEYYVPDGPFTNATYDLPLAQNLAPDYFVIVQGSVADTSDSGPDDDYVAVVADGYGTGEFPGPPAPVAANQLRLQRGSTSDEWSGVVTVVECLSDCDVNGFRLLDVRRVSHANANTSGTEASAVAWTDASRVMLVGGANGAGCDTADNDDLDHKSCHVRLFPSGASTINWTRDTGGANDMETATSTVMVVQWGSAWTVQRVRVTNGNNGLTALNTTGAYNPATIAPVARPRTFVWGTGHTNDSGVGEALEGVVITLGDGVAANGVETRVSAGIAYPDRDLELDVYALSHPGLAVDHAFRPNGSSGQTAVSVPVASATAPRMALSYNSAAAGGDNYPQPIFSARYESATSVRLQRARSGANFAAWVQGVDLSRIYGAASVVCANTLATCNEPNVNPDVLTPSHPRTLPPGSTLTLTYQVRIDSAPDPSLTEITNTASLTTTQNPTAVSGSVTDALARPAVDVDPNNAGYARAGETIAFTHTVQNRSTLTDSYLLTVTSEQGWRVDLVDPDTGVVLATDSNGDGTWDAGTPTTGAIVPGGSKEYRLRVWVTVGATPGIQDTVRLRATSGFTPAVWDDAKDEITVLPSGASGQVIVTPDNSGVVQAGSYTVYSHRVINNTAFADTFDFLPPPPPPDPPGTGTGVDSSLGWTNTIHWDTNGDGVYTPDIDLVIVNTAHLPPGGSQLVFVRVNAPGGTASGTREVSHITAWSRRDNALFGAATDTSTVVTTPRHDLSGGGSRVVAPGDTAVFPGTIVNLGSAADSFELEVTASNLYGPDGDGLLHPTRLVVDSDADGVPDLQIAEDTDGDGTWDVVPPAGPWNSDGDSWPDVPVAGGGSFAYELRRPIGLDQKVQRDHVTLTSRSVGSPATDPDNVTATWIFAAVTRAGIQGLRVRPGEVAFATSTQSRTASFVLFQTDDSTGATGREALHDQPVVSPVPESITPILYTVLARPVEKRFLTIEETETDGDTHWTGPFAVGEARLERPLARLERRLDAAGVPEGRARWLKGYRRPGADPARRAAATPSTTAASPIGGGRTEAGAKIEVARGGQVRIPALDLAAYGLSETEPRRRLWLTNFGHPVPYSWERRAPRALELVFEAAPLRTDYSDRNVYLLTLGPPKRGNTGPLTRSADPATPGFRRAEREQLYVPSLPEGADPWQWDILFSGAPWPDPDYDPAAGDFDLPDLAPAASGPVSVRVRVVGYTHHRHDVSASINGEPVGSLTFDGIGPALLVGTVPAESLRPAGNRLSVAYTGSALPDSPASEAFAYLDYVDLGAPASSASGPASFSLAPWRPQLPSFRGVEYLVVTHPMFRAQTDRIAAEKEADGLRTAVVETTTAYDCFSGGVVEPRAIQALVRSAARASGALRHVLLVGDDSFDPLDHSGRGVPSLVPSLFARDSGWGLVPSENLYADLDDDGLPDVAIGRLPVRTTAEADAAADKIAGQRAALEALGEAHLAVADNTTESDAPFREDAQRALDLLVDGASVGWADLAEGASAARAALLAGWQSGVLGTHYFGHGGLTEWADEQVLTTDDVAALGSSWRPTTLFTWACLSQYHLGVDGPSLNESLVLQAGGGALASFGPAGITPPARQAVLVAHVYDELRARGTSLGEAIRRAKVAAAAEQPSAREVIEGFQLFGDPALVLYPSDPAPR